MAYASWSVVFGEQPSAAKWNILGTNDASFNDGTGIGNSAITPEKLLTGTGTDWVWDTFTPSWTNLVPGTGGNALNTGYYLQIGKTVFYRVAMIFGTTAPSMGTAPRFVAPVAPNADYYKSSIGLSATVGEATLLDAGITEYHGHVRISAAAPTTSFEVVSWGASSTYVNVGSTTGAVPFTWAPGDGLFLTGVYEAA